MGQNNSYERLTEPDSRQQTRNNNSSGIHNPMFTAPQSNSWKSASSNSNNSWSNNNKYKDSLLKKDDKRN